MSTGHQRPHGGAECGPSPLARWVGKPPSSHPPTPSRARTMEVYVPSQAREGGFSFIILIGFSRGQGLTCRFGRSWTVPTGHQDPLGPPWWTASFEAESYKTQGVIISPSALLCMDIHRTCHNPAKYSPPKSDPRLTRLRRSKLVKICRFT